MIGIDFYQAHAQDLEGGEGGLSAIYIFLVLIRIPEQSEAINFVESDVYSIFLS